MRIFEALEIVEGANQSGDLPGPLWRDQAVGHTHLDEAKLVKLGLDQPEDDLAKVDPENFEQIMLRIIDEGFEEKEEEKRGRDESGQGSFDFLEITKLDLQFLS